ncbi:hypothetical protein K493DRAFT_411364 [Basidiobolus meristosporus CBS 931.73]|uniref:Yeast cell wall synthesis Kre9/Knh1-like N-terminal domain-containing protein n=1 Tax=Basidiobolus meristosporus CBS 931.73 TaxID=1314790 RepID=A0A1Y1XK15_9FUNG|nr:hypothetical protein K493DRAFT_411364 [Basidiobolus meristosporus CBS 931.73]|eukprot:ORX86088.1 hypothetical protein K493DRAFT_411364 [Basidiobolus meristosporus CBS 931.73]
MLQQAAQILFVASLVCYSVVDATLAFTAPLGVDWKAGTKNIITWTDNGDGKGMPETFDLYLLNGNANTLQLVANVASGVSSAAGTYEWTIPTDIAPGQYVLRAGGGDGSYTPYFTITAPDANASESPSSSASASASVAPPVPTTSKSYAATVTVTTTIPNTAVSSVASSSATSSPATDSSSASSVVPESTITSVVPSSTLVSPSVTQTTTADPVATPPQQNANAERVNGAVQAIPSIMVILMSAMLSYLATFQ